MRPAVIFLDDGGVLNDNDVRAREWGRLIGEYLAPRLGGAPAAWGVANRDVFGRQLERFFAWRDARLEADEGANFFALPEERERWLRGMCETVGVAIPPDAVAVAEATEAYVLPRIRAAYADAPDAVRALRRAGYTLATASGGTSHELDLYLTGMGVRDCFDGPLFGPDLVRALKGGPLFYQRIFDAMGVAPADALVADNEPRALARAAEAGARTVHVARDGGPGADAADHAIRDLAELVALVD